MEIPKRAAGLWARLERRLCAVPGSTGFLPSLAAPAHPANPSRRPARQSFGVGGSLLRRRNPVTRNQSFYTLSNKCTLCSPHRNRMFFCAFAASFCLFGVPASAGPACFSERLQHLRAKPIQMLVHEYVTRKTGPFQSSLIKENQGKLR